MDSSRYNIRGERRNIQRSRFTTEFIVVLIFTSAMVISLILFVCLYSKQNNRNKKGIITRERIGQPNDSGSDNGKNGGNQTNNKDPFNNIQIIIDCNIGYFIPSDDKSKNPQCIKCKTENCDSCYGTKNNNICSECNSYYESKKENGIIISCIPKICQNGVNECKECDYESNKCKECNPGYYIPSDDNTYNNCLKCSVGNCTYCNGSKYSNNCYECDSNLIPYYSENDENKIIESCNTCEIGKDEKCSTCNNDICSTCNFGYILNEGKCKINYSFKVEYYTDKNNLNNILISPI